MNKEKQIEEMAIDLCPLYEKYGSCKKCDEELDIDDEPCLYKCMAKLCIEKGYRKASDVAEEIFAEIEEGIKAAVSALQFENNPIHRSVKHETYSRLMRFIKSVEQKYTEGGRDKIAEFGKYSPLSWKYTEGGE